MVVPGSRSLASHALAVYSPQYLTTASPPGTYTWPRDRRFSSTMSVRDSKGGSAHRGGEGSEEAQGRGADENEETQQAAAGEINGLSNWSRRGTTTARPKR